MATRPSWKTKLSLNNSRRSLLILRYKHWLLAASLCWLTSAHADERDFSGTVRRIFDGDSFLVRPAGRATNGKDINVRLQDIDAPEKSQPYGNSARVALVNLIADRDVFVDVVDTDHYDRKIVRVFREPDRLDVIKAMVRDGHVWVYRKKLHDESLIKLEDAARAAHRGIWALPDEDLLPPWQYRYLRRKGQRTSSTPVSLLMGQQRPWYSERTQAGRFHEPITPVPGGIVVSPGAVRGSEASAGWTVVVP